MNSISQDSRLIGSSSKRLALNREISLAYEETLQVDIEIDQKRETEITTENKKRLIRKNC